MSVTKYSIEELGRMTQAEARKELFDILMDVGQGHYSPAGIMFLVDPSYGCQEKLDILLERAGAKDEASGLVRAYTTLVEEISPPN